MQFFSRVGGTDDEHHSPPLQNRNLMIKEKYNLKEALKLMPYRLLEKNNTIFPPLYKILVLSHLQFLHYKDVIYHISNETLNRKLKEESKLTIIWNIFAIYRIHVMYRGHYSNITMLNRHYIDADGSRKHITCVFT